MSSVKDCATRSPRRLREEELAATNIKLPRLFFDNRTGFSEPLEPGADEAAAWPSDRPLVSVVIVSFNYGHFVAEAVDSVLAQTFDDLEVIVVEGGSTHPRSREQTLALTRPKTTVVAQTEPHQVGANRNFGISKARGKYICCLDADDLLKPTYIEKAVFLLETYGYDVVSCAMQQFGSSDEKVGILGEPVLADILEGNHVLTCALFRRSLRQKAGGYRDTDRAVTGHVYEDWLFWSQLAAMGARQSTVFTLLDRNASQREIHRLTGVDRKTIRRYRALRAGAEANSPGEVTTGPVSVDGQIPPPRPPAFGASEATVTSSLARSACEAHRTWIEEQVRLKRNAQAIYQDLVDQFGFPSSYQSVKRFVRRLRHSDPEQFDRLEFLPGEEAQVDYGEGAPTVDPKSGRYRRPRLFVMTLRYSRRSFRRVVWQSSQRVWAQLHEEAFRYFGGVPSYVVLDNLKEGVLKPDLYEPQLNPIYSAMLAHYAVVADPARVADPNRKGCVENAIQHTQSTALAGRRFETLEAQNEFLRHWEENWASKRIHGSTRRQVEAMFQEEKPHLRPLPVAAFRIFTEVVRTVCDDTTVRVDSSYYAARPAPIGSQVVVRIYASTIEIRDRHTHALLRVHPRMTHSGSVVLPTSERPFNPSRQTAVLLASAERIGPQTRALCQQMFDTEGRPGQRAMWGIVGLSRKYPARLVEQACAHAIDNRIYRYKHVRATVERLFEQAIELVGATPRPASPLTQDHPLIRSPAEYGDLFSRAARHDADDNPRQAGAHDSRARVACATPASSGATSAPTASSHLKLETRPHDDHAGN
ncbi:transposase [Bradyrhizobium elkanii]